MTLPAAKINHVEQSPEKIQSRKRQNFCYTARRRRERAHAGKDGLQFSARPALHDCSERKAVNRPDGNEANSRGKQQREHRAAESKNDNTCFRSAAREKPSEANGRSSCGEESDGGKFRRDGQPCG